MLASGYSFHHQPIRRPRANLLLIALGHYATDLQKVTQIVRGPRRHQLPGGYNAKSWMHPLQFQFLWRQVHCPKSRDTIQSRIREFLQQGRERFPITLAERRLASKRLKGEAGAILQNDR